MNPSAYSGASVVAGEPQNLLPKGSAHVEGRAAGPMRSEPAGRRVVTGTAHG
jgi:hypothetical protein